MQVYICCAGGQKRWEGPGLKQLIPLAGVPLLQITIGQVRKLANVQPTVIGHAAKLWRKLDGATMQWNKAAPRPDPCLCATISDTQPWRDDIVFLLGDVFYDGPALKLILGDQVPFRFYGRDYEIFALRVSVLASERVASLLGQLLLGKLQRPSISGRLWDLFYTTIGKVIDPVQAPLHQTVFTYIPSPTQDFDRAGDYRSFLAQHEWARAKEA